MTALPYPAKLSIAHWHFAPRSTYVRCVLEVRAQHTLIWKALCALDQVAEQSRRAPVAPTAAIRFALAFLYANTGSNRAALVEFYRVIQMPDADGFGGKGSAYQRGTMACTLLHRIARSVGVERQAPEVCEAMRQSWEQGP